MRLVLLALAAVGSLVLWRRRRPHGSHVVVGWRDGAELELDGSSPAHAQSTSVAERVLA
ncbi:MAG TPA: hypothetical protein VH305_05645 [Gaiella sp.]|jgi:hypothetical protein